MPSGFDWTKLLVDTIGGGLTAGDSAEQAAKQRQLSWQEALLGANTSLANTNTARAQDSASLAARQALLPLADRGFTGLQAQFGAGPSPFGHVGDANAAVRTAQANYRPNQNPSMNALGTAWADIQKRFAPATTTPEAGTPGGGAGIMNVPDRHFLHAGTNEMLIPGTYPNQNYRVDAQGHAYDLTTGQRLEGKEVELRNSKVNNV